MTLSAIEGAEYEWVVERGKIWEFAQACLDPDPTYLAADAVAPPTFATTATGYWWTDDPFPGLTDILSLDKAFHGEQEYEFARPLRAGDVLRVSTRVADRYERTGDDRVLRFAVYETTFRDSAHEIVLVARGTAVEVTPAGATPPPPR